MGPGGLRDFAEPRNESRSLSGLRIEKNEAASLSEDEMPRIRAPDRILAFCDGPRAAVCDIEDGDLKRAAFTHVERDLFAVRRAVWLCVIAVARREMLRIAASFGNAIELRRAVVIVGIDDLIPAGHPRG